MSAFSFCNQWCYKAESVLNYLHKIVTLLLLLYFKIVTLSGKLLQTILVVSITLYSPYHKVQGLIQRPISDSSSCSSFFPKLFDMETCQEILSSSIQLLVQLTSAFTEDLNLKIYTVISPKYHCFLFGLVTYSWEPRGDIYFPLLQFLQLFKQ